MNAIVNTGDHDSTIADHVHISPGACLAGGVMVGRASNIGVGATVIQNVSVGERALVAAGAVVVDDVPSGALATGVPARFSMATKP
jgi:acetyltransferase-like isoleucine patch superfamily enzyme